MAGWTGKLLRVDLTGRSVGVEPLNMAWARDFIGGRGLAARYLYAEMDPKVDALSPDNTLIFATGPLTGTNASCGARYMVVTKGALTGAITTSNSGGHWGPELKFAGYDMVIVEGRATEPVYLWIYDDDVKIRDAGRLWGKTTWEAEDAIREESGVPDAVVASIGPAGERLVRFACIINDRHRAAGRSGVGAVMGSKNLKAIAVRGTRGVTVADPKAFLEATWSAKARLAKNPMTGSGFARFGTLATMDPINEVGALPTFNHQQGQFEGVKQIGAGALKKSGRLLTNKACFACTIACGRVTRVTGEGAARYVVHTSRKNWRLAAEGPEYENAWSLGAECGVSDQDAILIANYLCNELGMDPISMGVTIAAAMELFERGVIKEEQCGVALRFGSGEALVRMVEATGWRKGFGDELAEGSMRLTAKFGHPQLFMGVKGQEFPAYDPRGLQGMGLGFATSNRGACHLRAFTAGAEVFGKMDRTTTEGKAELTKKLQDTGAASYDASGLCSFVDSAVGPREVATVLIAATGVPYTVEELLKAGERIHNLERVFNLRAGFAAKDDTLPPRMLSEPPPAGPSAGMVSRLHEMLPRYYEIRGWDAEGRPTAAKLAELGLA
jgi:aldehyde:ferredoxin oxidoreductase